MLFIHTDTDDVLLFVFNNDAYEEIRYIPSVRKLFKFLEVPKTINVSDIIRKTTKTKESSSIFRMKKRNSFNIMC